MKFNEGDIVRYKSEVLPMTVAWQAVEGRTELVCCAYFDDQKKQVFIKARPDMLEYVPNKVLKKLQRKQNQTGLKSFFENHPLVIYLSIGIIAFTAGFGVPGIIQNITGQELVTKGTYITNKDFSSLIESKYINKSDYEQIVNENSKLKSLLEKKTGIQNQEIVKQINALTEKRDKLLGSLQDIRARNSPLQYPDPLSPKVISTEEQDALNNIDQINKEILLLYGKI